MVVECSQLSAIHACIVSDIFKKLAFVPGAVDEKFQVFNIRKVVIYTDLIDVTHFPDDLADEVGAIEGFRRVYILCKPARGNFKWQDCLKETE